MSCDPCNQSPICSDDVNYSGPNLVCTTIGTCDSMSTAFQKLNSTICSLQSTIVILQNKLNSYTTTTTTSSSTSTTSTSSTTTTTSSTSSTTTVYNPTIYRTARYLSGAEAGNPNEYTAVWYRKNGGTWTQIGGGGRGPIPLTYYGVSTFASLGIVIGDVIDIGVRAVTTQSPYETKFGVGFTTSPSSGVWNAFCGITSYYTFTFVGGHLYINQDISGGRLVICSPCNTYTNNSGSSWIGNYAGCDGSINITAVIAPGASVCAYQGSTYTSFGTSLTLGASCGTTTTTTTVPPTTTTTTTRT